MAKSRKNSVVLMKELIPAGYIIDVFPDHLIVTGNKNFTYNFLDVITKTQIAAIKNRSMPMKEFEKLLIRGKFEYSRAPA